MKGAARNGAILIAVLIVAGGGYALYRSSQTTVPAPANGQPAASSASTPAAQTAPAVTSPATKADSTKTDSTKTAAATGSAEATTPATPGVAGTGASTTTSTTNAGTTGAPAATAAANAPAPGGVTVAEKAGSAAEATPSGKPDAPTFDVVRVEKSGDATLAGRSVPNADIVLYANGAVVGRTKADAQGNWVMVLERPLAPGEYDLALTSVAPGDKSETEAIDHIAVSIPKNRSETPLVAVVTKSGPTRVLQQPGSAEAPSAEAPAGAGVSIAKVELQSGTLHVTGTAAPNAPVRLYVDDVPVAEGKAAASGTFDLAGTTPLATGAHQVRVDQVAGGDAKVVARAEVPFTNDLPVASTKIEGGVETAKAHEVVIRRGDDLWSIAERLYGTGDRYVAIYRANKKQIRNPDLIYPGQVFTLPTP